MLLFLLLRTSFGSCKPFPTSEHHDCRAFVLGAGISPAPICTLECRNREAVDPNLGEYVRRQVDSFAMKVVGAKNVKELVVCTFSIVNFVVCETGLAVRVAYELFDPVTKCKRRLAQNCTIGKNVST